MQRLVLSSFLAVPHFLSLVFLFGVFYCYRPSVMTSLSALSVLLLMYSLRFLISSSTVCLICRSPLPQFFAEGIVYQCHSGGVEYDGQSWASWFSSSDIVQSTMPAVYLITGTVQLLIAWIVIIIIIIIKQVINNYSRMFCGHYIYQ